MTEPFFIYVEFFWEVIEDTNYLIAFFNLKIFFEKFYKSLEASGYETIFETFLMEPTSLLSAGRVGIVYLKQTEWIALSLSSLG